MGRELIVYHNGLTNEACAEKLDMLRKILDRLARNMLWHEKIYDFEKEYAKTIVYKPAKHKWVKVPNILAKHRMFVDKDTGFVVRMISGGIVIESGIFNLIAKYREKSRKRKIVQNLIIKMNDDFKLSELFALEYLLFDIKPIP